MHFEGTVEIAAPRPKVWAFVIDPVEAGSCGPGVESVEASDATHFKARAKVGIGFINARFVLDGQIVTVTESRLPRSRPTARPRAARSTARPRCA